MEGKNINKAEIFISYSRKDKEYVDRFVVHMDVLNAYEERFDCFVDRTDIELNERWRDSVIRNIMVAIFSSSSLVRTLLIQNLLKKRLVLVKNRQKKEKEFVLIPFLIRECFWEEHPIADFPVFPRNQPVRYVAEAPNPDAALTELVRFINRHVKSAR